MIQFRGRGVASLKIAGVRGDSCLGFQRLVLSVVGEVAASGSKSFYYITNLAGEVLVRGNGGFGYAGRAVLTDPHFPMHPDVGNNCSVELETTRAGLEEIELLRAGAGVEFEVTLKGLLRDGQGTQEPFVDTATLRMNQSDWLEVLAQLKCKRPVCPPG